MTKLLKIAIVAVLMGLIAMFFMVNDRLQRAKDSEKSEIAKLYARKDDLISEQQKLETLINALNRTLDSEMQKQAVLYAELKAVQKDLNMSANNTVKVTIPKPVTVEIPVPTPSPRPVTRAS
jgi:peptidoglycan hydrolase CwlO-like protein